MDILPIEDCSSCYMCITNLDEVFSWCAIGNRYQGRRGWYDTWMSALLIQT